MQTSKYSQLKQEVQKTRELVSEFVMTVTDRNFHLTKEVMEILEQVTGRMSLAEQRRTISGKNESARNSLPFVKECNEKLQETLELCK